VASEDVWKKSLSKKISIPDIRHGHLWPLLSIGKNHDILCISLYFYVNVKILLPISFEQAQALWNPPERATGTLIL
jgi:hypothetical protein